MLKATITYLRGGRIPEDVIREDEIPVAGLSPEAFYARQHLGEALKQCNVPKGCVQINAVLWIAEQS